jgi:hypothetical protein
VQQPDLGPNPVDLFQSACKTISEQNKDANLLSNILSNISFYYLRYVELPPTFHSLHRVSANALNELAITIYPENIVAKVMEEKIFKSAQGLDLINPSKRFLPKSVTPCTTQFDELFNEGIENFLIELETVYNTAPDGVTLILGLLTEKLIECENMATIVPTLKKLINELKALLSVSLVVNPNSVSTISVDNNSLEYDNSTEINSPRK